MNRNLCKKGMVLGIIFLFFGASVVLNKGESVNKDDQYITDDELDIYYVFGPGDNDWDNSTERSKIDIEKISYRASNGELNLTLELYDDIEDSDNILYHAYYRSEDATYLFFWRNGSGFGLEWPEHFEKDAAMLTIDEDKFTIKDENVSCTFDLLGDDVSKGKLYGYAYEWINYTDEDNFEYWVDFAFGGDEEVTPYKYKKDKLDSVYVKENYGSDDPCYQIDHFETMGDGIDNVNAKGDVYVFNGTYYEKVVVDKSINLLGENKSTTVIDADGSGNTVKIELAGGVTITGFSIKGGNKSGICISELSSGNNIFDNDISYNKHYGIKIDGYNNNIESNLIKSNGVEGILIDESVHSVVIEHNVIADNGKNTSKNEYGNGNGIHLLNYAMNIEICDNTIKGSFHDGIHLNQYCQNITIDNNNISECIGYSAGIYLEETTGVICIRNTIFDNTYGIYVVRLIQNNNGNKIYLNTIDGNDKNIYIWESIFLYGSLGDQLNVLTDNNIVNAREYAIRIGLSIVWAWSNWWGSDLLGPRVGYNRVNGLKFGFCAFPWATEPYDISRDYLNL